MVYKTCYYFCVRIARILTMVMTLNTDRAFYFRRVANVNNVNVSIEAYNPKDSTTQAITSKEQLDEDIDTQFSEAVNSKEEKLDAEKVKSVQVVEKLKGG